MDAAAATLNALQPALQMMVMSKAMNRDAQSMAILLEDMQQQPVAPTFQSGGMDIRV